MFHDYDRPDWRPPAPLAMLCVLIALPFALLWDALQRRVS